MDVEEIQRTKPAWNSICRLSFELEKQLGDGYVVADQGTGFDGYLLGVNFFDPASPDKLDIIAKTLAEWEANDQLYCDQLIVRMYARELRSWLPPGSNISTEQTVYKEAKREGLISLKTPVVHNTEILPGGTKNEYNLRLDVTSIADLPYVFQFTEHLKKKFKYQCFLLIVNFHYSIDHR